MDITFFDCKPEELLKIIKAVKVLAQINQSATLAVRVKGTFEDRKQELVFLTQYSLIKIDSVTKNKFFSVLVDGNFVDVKPTGEYKRLDIHVTF